MSEINFIGYEYKDFTVKRNIAALYSDSIENFGWEPESTTEVRGKTDSISMKFRRNRKIRNKSELTRLQRQLDSSIVNIQSLEFSKYLKASTAAYVTGVIGTAFMAGSVFAVTSGNTTLCVVLAIPGFVGWILPYWIYRSIYRKKLLEVTPMIDKKYDEIYEVCEKATNLLDK